jgi:carboxyl-terminal processing protease
MTIFWANISWEFKESLEALKKEKGIKKVIFDLRNNWGWYLDQVSDMLGHFVPKWKTTAVVKYLKWEQNYYSKGYNLIDFSKYKIVILQNGWTASASEIFIWTVKDYFPKSTIIWEQSYWKGSVQTIKSYKDWSSFKYTVARWFTGKSQTWINWIWITPDINLEFDFDRFKKYDKDNQLEKAKNLR